MCHFTIDSREITSFFKNSVQNRLKIKKQAFKETIVNRISESASISHISFGDSSTISDKTSVQNRLQIKKEVFINETNVSNCNEGIEEMEWECDGATYREKDTEFQHQSMEIDELWDEIPGELFNELLLTNTPINYVVPDTNVFLYSLLSIKCIIK